MGRVGSISYVPPIRQNIDILNRVVIPIPIMRLIKFVFSKKATKIDKIFTVLWHLLHNVKSTTVKISTIFVALLESMNFNAHQPANYYSPNRIYRLSYGPATLLSSWKSQFSCQWWLGTNKLHQVYTTFSVTEFSWHLGRKIEKGNG